MCMRTGARLVSSTEWSRCMTTSKKRLLGSRERAGMKRAIRRWGLAGNSGDPELTSLSEQTVVFTSTNIIFFSSHSCGKSYSRIYIVLGTRVLRAMIRLHGFPVKRGTRKATWFVRSIEVGLMGPSLKPSSLCLKRMFWNKPCLVFWPVVEWVLEY